MGCDLSRGGVFFLHNTHHWCVGDRQRMSPDKAGVYLKQRKHSAKKMNQWVKFERGMLLGGSSKLFTEAILQSECLFGRLFLFLVTCVPRPLVPRLILRFAAVKQQVLKSHFQLKLKITRAN